MSLLRGKNLLCWGWGGQSQAFPGYRVGSAAWPGLVLVLTPSSRCGWEVEAAQSVLGMLGGPFILQVNPTPNPPGQGPSKKAAKHRAAEVALKHLKGGSMLEPALEDSR